MENGVWIVFLMPVKLFKDVIIKIRRENIIMLLSGKAKSGETVFHVELFTVPVAVVDI